MKRPLDKEQQLPLAVSTTHNPSEVQLLRRPLQEFSAFPSQIAALAEPVAKRRIASKVVDFFDMAVLRL